MKLFKYKYTWMADNKPKTLAQQIDYKISNAYRDGAIEDVEAKVTAIREILSIVIHNLPDPTQLKIAKALELEVFNERQNKKTTGA